MKNPFKRTQTLDDVVAYFGKTIERLREFEATANTRLSEIDAQVKALEEESYRVSTERERGVRIRENLGKLVASDDFYPTSDER